MDLRSAGKIFVVTASATAVAALTACGSDNNAGTVAGEQGVDAVDCGGKKSLKASGATAQANAMTRFVTAYEAACPGFTLNYTSSGSGAGVSEFVGGQTDMGGSDSPLNADKGEVEKAKARCGGAEAWNLPMVFGPVAITYNAPGVDSLVLDGPTAAKIFNGTVTTWNAPEIAALNPGVTLPAGKINTVDPRHLLEHRHHDLAGAGIAGTVHADQVAVEDAFVAHRIALHLQQVIRRRGEEGPIQQHVVVVVGIRTDRRAGRHLSQHGHTQALLVRGRECQIRLGRRWGLEQADAAGAARHAFDGARLFQRLQVVLGSPHALETEGLGDFGLRRRHALGLQPFGDQGKDGELGIGQVHG